MGLLIKTHGAFRQSPTYIRRVCVDGYLHLLDALDRFDYSALYGRGGVCMAEREGRGVDIFSRHFWVEYVSHSLSPSYRIG